MSGAREIFYIAAVVCFVVALLMSLISSFGNGQDQNSWMIGGFVALALALSPFPDRLK
jgi:hypothetical protein